MKIKCSRCQHKKQESDLLSQSEVAEQRCVFIADSKIIKRKCKLHNKTNCRLCGDGKHIKIKRMVYNSKQQDMKLNRYDANNHVDYCFIEQLMDESMICYYCSERDSTTHGMQHLPGRRFCEIIAGDGEHQLLRR